MAILLCLYAALLLAVLAFTITRNWRPARLALVATTATLCGIILVEGAASARGPLDLPGFQNLGLTASLPLLGLGLTALFVTRWRWLFWFVLILNMLAGACVFMLCRLYLTTHS